MSRPILIRTFLAVVVLGIIVAVASYSYEAHVRQDAASAVRIAIDARLNGDERQYLSFLGEYDENYESIDIAQFILDVKSGYEIKSGPMWMNVYDVEIHTKNGRRYAASPMRATTHLSNRDEFSYWSIACCEPRN